MTSPVRPRIHRKAVTESTNLDARAGSHGDVFVADFQTAGRGRLDHEWLSAAGENLMLSAVLGVDGLDPAQVATLPLVVGLAVVRAVSTLLPPQAAENLGVKWPNDVMLAGRKLAGILCERNGDCVIAGVGLNVNQRSFPGEISERATSLAIATGAALPLDAFLPVVLDAVFSVHAAWRAGGFAAFMREFSERDLLAGRMVSIRQTDSDSAPVSGICAGVRADGALLVGGVAVHAGEAHVLPASKADVRREMRRLRKAVPPQTRAARSADVSAKILAREDVRALVATRRVFALYLATPEEIDLHGLAEALWNAGCAVCVPAWDAARQTYRLALHAPGAKLVAGPMGILEPPPDAPSVAPRDVAAWIVPGLAFDPSGRRVGYGGGWYDRFLASAAPDALKLGVCHGFQLLSELPHDHHDAVLSGVVVSEKE